MYETRSAAELSGVGLDCLFPLYPDRVSEDDDNKDRGHTKQICDLQDLPDQSAGGVSGLQ